MTRVEQRPSAVVASAMVCSGVVTAQFIAGKATRDALYLAALDVTTLPANAIRRRVGRVLSSCPSQTAADGLMRGLRDERFDVRFQCAQSLAAIVKANAQLRIDREAIFEIVERELVRDRASRSIDHLVTILSLVLPAEPLRIAFQGLRSGDPGLRGTAQEYLEGVLPAAIRDRVINYTPN